MRVQPAHARILSSVFFVDVTIARERKDWLGAKSNEFKTTSGALTVSWANLAQNVLVKFVCESDRAKN